VSVTRSRFITKTRSERKNTKFFKVEHFTTFVGFRAFVISRREKPF